MVCLQYFAMPLSVTVPKTYMESRMMAAKAVKFVIKLLENRFKWCFSKTRPLNKVLLNKFFKQIKTHWLSVYNQTHPNTSIGEPCMYIQARMNSLRKLKTIVPQAKRVQSK